MYSVHQVLDSMYYSKEAKLRAASALGGGDLVICRWAASLAPPPAEPVGHRGHNVAATVGRPVMV